MDYLRFWGKADGESGRWRPLVLHMLDVAAVARQWLLRHPAFLDEWACRLQVERDVLADLVTFLTAIHDLGKFALDFQFKIPQLATLLTGRTGISYASRASHPSSGFGFWDASIWGQIKDQLSDLSPADMGGLNRSIRPLLTASFGHHGKPVESLDPLAPPPLRQLYDDEVRRAAAVFIDALLGMLPGVRVALAHWGLNRSLKSQLASFSFPLSGLIILADWTGSSSDNFPLNLPFTKEPASEFDLKKAFSESLELADAALLRQGLVAVPRRKLTNPWEELFPTFKPYTPTLLQAAMLQATEGRGPALYIIEDIAGAGKTEAALLLTASLMDKENVEGFYFALPTMATSNGMYSRLAAIYSNYFASGSNASLILAHGRPELNAAFQDSLLPEHSRVTDVEFNATDAEEQQTTRAACNTWIADRARKAFLAQVGVGSIDQALLSVIYSKHNTLRMFGLSRKILIVDEVHAYDAYMQELLESLIKFQAQQGRSVVLLSATLPVSMKDSLGAAYLSGCNGQGDEPEVNLREEMHYPLITIVESGKADFIPIEPSARHCRSVGVEFLTSEDGAIEPVVERLAEISREGRCAVWIRNTVADVQRAYDQLSVEIDADKLFVFHSRFAMGHRSDIEERVLRIFGKESTSVDRQGRILIATQVVEQSLDLDFDEMITDLCPIDLVIQRVGRLRRHTRDQSGNRIDTVDERGVGTVLIFGPDPDTTIEADWYMGCFPGGAKVYQNHGILWRTASVLKRERQIEIPARLRYLIEAVYGETETPNALVEQSHRAHSADDKAGFTAQTNLIDLEKGFLQSSDLNPWPDHSAPTRLTDETRTYRLCLLEGSTVRPLVASNDQSFALSEVKFRPVEVVLPSELRRIIEEAERRLPDQGRGGSLLPFEQLGQGLYRSLGETTKQERFVYSEKLGLRLETEPVLS
jgi:CRISPR-associated endonuclease/helicase Cas3